MELGAALDMARATDVQHSRVTQDRVDPPLLGTTTYPHPSHTLTLPSRGRSTPSGGQPEPGKGSYRPRLPLRERPEVASGRGGYVGVPDQLRDLGDVNVEPVHEDRPEVVEVPGWQLGSGLRECLLE